MSESRPESHSTSRKITLVALGVVLIGTVFLLPQLVTEPWVAGNVEELPPVPEASPSTVSPSSAAELTRYRQESQTVLAEIMAMRDRLTESAVERWAQVEFQQALDMIEAGDELYSYGDYESSLKQFREANSRLAELEVLGQQKLAAARSDAQEAIEALNLNIALASTDLASAIAPLDKNVQQLAARAANLEQLARLIDAGDQEMALDLFEGARLNYRKAAELDPLHKRAASSLAAANKELTASVYRGHMSRGFAALESRDYAGARSAFLRAGKIYPGDVAVKKAIEQVDNRESGNVVLSELQRAAELETDEEWHEAVNIYDTLLEQDPSLSDARVRLITARVHADLDRRLSGYIEEPLRLSNQAEYLAAQATLEDAKSIASPGPRLRGQIAELASLVKIANSPVDVIFSSDNQTHVVLQRVAELGRFAQVSVKLRPGKYVAAGTRSGYRDVRIEFTVTGDPLEKPITVRCEEPVG